MQYDYTLATAPESVAVIAAIDLIEREYGAYAEPEQLSGNLKNLRYRLRGRR